jgi:4-amino-4-deoxy-L-arabinose transferase-like glycosyltransferase
MVTAGAEPKRLPLGFLQAVTLYWIALKVFALFVGEPHADEAYYWMWGQHLALSYFDHAPLHAWLQGAVAAVLGWSVFALRFLSIVTAAVTLWVLYLWARRLTPETWRHTFWLAAALFWSAPLMLFYTTVATHDRLLVAFTLLALHGFAWFLADWADGRRDRFGMLYFGAVCLGLATLTKYNGALVGVGIAAAILMRGDLRSVLRSPHLYLAAALSVLMQFPTLYWNYAEGFASFRFHLANGAGNPFDPSLMRVDTIARLSLETLLLLSPIAVGAMIWFVVKRAGSGFGGVLHSLGKGVFVVSTLFNFGLALTRSVLFYWNIPAYAAFFGMSPLFLRSRVLQALQIGYGVVVGTILIVQFTVFPVLQTVGFNQPQTGGLFGWEEIAKRVTDAQQARNADFVAGAEWGVAARLGFALRDPNVPALTDTLDAYDYWTDPADLAGRDAIVLTTREDRPNEHVAKHFASFEPIEEFTVERGGVPYASYRLYLGRDYTPPPMPSAAP